jgi:N-acetylglucosaminyldiphosphoundecaprenol N-acetyl-beta-D-mannosaminyltransferase
MEQVLTMIDDAVAKRRRLLIGVVNAAKLVAMRANDLLRKSVLDADVILADGMAVVWACRLLGTPIPERVTGIDLMERMLSRGNERGYRIYFLGATADVLDLTLARVRAGHPGVIVAGSHHGYFGPEDQGDIAASIRKARPDILLVAMSSPKKEQFLARWADELDVPVCHGVGGAFDVFAGKVRRAPLGWQRWGLEWLFRLVQEPGRLGRRYLVTNAVFAWLVLSAWWRKRRPSQAPA